MLAKSSNTFIILTKIIRDFKMHIFTYVKNLFFDNDVLVLTENISKL